MKKAKILIAASLLLVAAAGAFASSQNTTTTLWFYIDDQNPSLGTDSDDFTVSCPREALGCEVFVTKDGINEIRQLYTDAAAQHPVAPQLP
ncbi:DUF6520 family protein [Chitinophaga sedimenti]|uniref:DUF6520 family protein n=1 Tax=Chitinophaga sedimenti TaxID=2033606 RepID=UPI002004D91F|nr:DUF6520 family protein [Chitinophaga sedimenti]MCK7553745.1 DUF6520 family protein [Chitinophaga sedimenti]